MVCPSLNQMNNLFRFEPRSARPVETITAKIQKFAEESTFFVGLFKTRTVKSMPNAGLIMVLNRDETRKKERKVNKKSKPDSLYFTRKQQEEEPANEDESEALV